MAYRKPAGRKFQVTKVLPIWGASHTNAVNMAFEALMLKFGISDTRSYFLKLRILIVIAVLVCALGGAYNYGIKGFILGGVLGLAAPAAILWLGILLIGVVAYLAIYCLVWALILCCLLYTSDAADE